MRLASWPRGTASRQSMMRAPRARRDEHGDRRGAILRRILEIQSGALEIYRRERRPALLLARVLINRACRVRLPQDPLTIP
jgi:hypothetical protein